MDVESISRYTYISLGSKFHSNRESVNGAKADPYINQVLQLKPARMKTLLQQVIVYLMQSLYHPSCPHKDGTMD